MQSVNGSSLVVPASGLLTKLRRVSLFVAGVYILLSVNDLVLLSFNALWIKSLLLLLLLILTPLASRKHRMNLCLIYYGVGLVCLLWLIISIIYGNDFDYMVSHLFSLMVTLLVPIVIITLCVDDLKSVKYLVEFFIFSIFIASVYKFFYVLYVSNFFSGPLLDFFYEGVRGRGELDGVYRSNTGNQLLVSLAVFVVFRMFLNGYYRLYMFFLMTVFLLNIYLAASVFFTFSTLALLIFFLSVHFFKKISVGGIALVLVAVLASFFLVSDIVSSRLGSSDGGNEIRLAQSSAIFDYFLQAPFFGVGVGFYIDSLVRSEITPFIYENQLFSLFMHLGLLGGIVYFLFILMPYFLYRNYFKYTHVAIFLGYVCVASIFNPYLIGTYAAISFVVVYFLSVLFGLNYKSRGYI